MLAFFFCWKISGPVIQQPSRECITESTWGRFTLGHHPSKNYAAISSKCLLFFLRNHNPAFLQDRIADDNRLLLVATPNFRKQLIFPAQEVCAARAACSARAFSQLLEDMQGNPYHNVIALGRKPSKYRIYHRKVMECDVLSLTAPEARRPAHPATRHLEVADVREGREAMALRRSLEVLVEAQTSNFKPFAAPLGQGAAVPGLQVLEVRLP